MENLITEHVRVNFNSTEQYLEVLFNGFIQYEEFVDAIQYELRMIRHYDVRKCVVNLQKIAMYPEGGVDYIKQVWFPEATKAGVTHVAFIVPENVFAQLDMQAAHAEAEDKVVMHTKYFIDAGAGLAWIKQF